MLLNCSLQSAINKFYDVLHQSISLYIPLKRLKSTTYPPWYSAELKKLLIKKKIANKNYKINNDFKFYAEFNDLRTNCNKLSYKCYQDY